MSRRFRLDFFVELEMEISSVDWDAMLYMTGKSAIDPKVYPSHSYFNDRKTLEPFLNPYKQDYSEGEYRCDLWESLESNYRPRGLHLCLPCIVSPYHFEILEALDWIASLSTTKGFAGTLADSYEKQAITLLAVYDKSLFWGDCKETQLSGFSVDRIQNVGY